MLGFVRKELLWELVSCSVFVQYESVEDWFVWDVVLTAFSFLFHVSSIVFLIGLEILACCFPNNAGLAVGSGSMTAGFGSIGFTAFFEWSVEKYGCVQALYMSGFVISTAIFLISIGVVWPQELCTSETIALTGIHLEDDNVSSGKLLDWSTMIKMPQFYMYSFLLLAEQAGYAFFAFFFVIGKRFGKESSALANAFEAMLLLGTVSRPVVGLLADKLSWGKGRFSIGSRNIMRILMLTQAVAYFGLIPASNAENYGVFSWCVAMIIMVFFCASGMALVLAKDIFGAGNSSLVFGAACSIGYGIGSFVWTKAVSVLEISGVETARAYNRFYWVAGLFNVVGIVSGVLLTRYEEGFERMPKKIFADIQIRGYGSLGGKVEEECLVELV